MYSRRHECQVAQNKLNITSAALCKGKTCRIVGWHSKWNCARMRIYICIGLHLSTYVQAYTCVRTYVSMYECMYDRRYVYIYIYIYIYIHTYIHICIYVYVAFVYYCWFFNWMLLPHSKYTRTGFVLLLLLLFTRVYRKIFPLIIVYVIMSIYHLLNVLSWVTA